MSKLNIKMLFKIIKNKFFQRETTFNLSQIRSKSMDNNNYRHKVYISRNDFAPIGVDLLKTECDVEIWNGKGSVSREELLKNIVGKNALFCSLSEKIDKEFLDCAGSSLKCVSTISVGYDHIDVAECKKRGVRIGYTPNVLTDATAELTLALLLATNRRIIEANKEVYNGGWAAWSPSWMCGLGIKGSTVGIYGFGRIGQEVAKRIVPFKPAKLLYSTRNRKDDIAKEIGAEYASFNDLISVSDIIIVCCALTPDTELKFNEDVFNKMKSNAIFINTARGGLVDQNALYNVLKHNRIWAAGLDVCTPEPLPLDHPLTTLKNIVLLPHIGSADITTRNEMSRITGANILNALKNEEMIYEI